jgi:hypothetical protein
MTEASRPKGTANHDASDESLFSPSDLQKLLTNIRVSISSDLLSSSSDLQELSSSKRAFVVTKKKITTVNVDSNLDDSMGLLRTCPNKKLDDGGSNSQAPNRRQ